MHRQIALLLGELVDENDDSRQTFCIYSFIWIHKCQFQGHKIFTISLKIHVVLSANVIRTVQCTQLVYLQSNELGNEHFNLVNDLRLSLLVAVMCGVPYTRRRRARDVRRAAERAASQGQAAHAGELQQQRG
jgi:hypothetical protein